jgi:methionyl aminopeptidase
VTGDVVSIDVTVYLNGWHGDTCATFICDQEGLPNHNASGDRQLKLVSTARQATLEGIQAVRPHRPLSDVGKAIEYAIYSSMHINDE